MSRAIARTMAHGFEQDERRILVKRYANGRCYAATFAPDMERIEVAYLIRYDVVRFLPYNEGTGMFLAGKGRIFKR